jgi:phosphatidylglycerol:prolipoprotein diacylglycerol transferase
VIAPPLIQPVPDPGFVWVATLLATLAYGIRSARKDGLDPGDMYWMSVCALLGGLWGAHLLGLLNRGGTADPLAWFRFWQGPSASFGAVAGAAAGSTIFLIVRSRPVLRYFDAAVPAAALAIVLGRIGCFLNGDDFGIPSRVAWAVQFPPGTDAYLDHLRRGWIEAGAAHSLPVHPAQLYASLAGLVMFVCLSRWRPRFAGGRFALFAVMYGASRFGLEWLRGDFNPALGPFSIPQAYSVLFAVIGLAVLLSRPGPRGTPVVPENGTICPPGGLGRYAG